MYLTMATVEGQIKDGDSAGCAEARTPAQPDQRREALALHLAAGLSVTAAARKARVSRRAAHNWLTEEGFNVRVRELRGVLFERCVSRLAGLSARAAAGLGKLFKSEDERIRLGAYRAALEHARGWGADDLAAKVADVLAKLEGVEKRVRDAEAAAGRGGPAAGPADGAGAAAPNPAAGGPGPDAVGGGLGPGPVAGEAPAGDSATSAHVLF